MALTRIISEIIQDNTVQDTDISASFQASISGSFGNQRVGTTDDVQFNHITASGNISSSGIVIADTFQSTGGSVDGISFTDDLNITGNITASGEISSSGNLSSTGNLDIDGTSNLQGDVTIQSDLGVVDINASGNITGSEVSSSVGSFTTVDIDGGTIDGITTFTAGGDLDIGAHDFRAATITADGLTATRVPFAGTDGVLSDDSDLTFATDTLTATKIGAFTAAGAIDFDNQNMTNVDIDSGVITGITDLTVADGGTGVSTLTDGGVLLGSGAGAITAMSALADSEMIVGDGSTDPVAESGATLRTSIGVGTADNVVFSNVSGAAATFNSATINGLLTVEEIHTVFVSASVSVATGSNIFGDAIIDAHQFTGSIDQSGSLSTVDVTSDNLFSSNITGSIISGSTALLTTATIDNIGAFKATGAIDFDNQNMTNVDIDSGVITGITDITVADGGTGVSTLTDGGVLLGSGTSAITAMAVLTDGQMIVGDGTTDPVAESGATLRTSIGVGTTNDVLFANITGSNVSASVGKFTTVDIDGGTIDGITSLTAGGDLDIGAHDLRAATITADGLTATRVPFAGTAGVLSDDSDLTFATATLSATNLTTTGTIKNMALVSGSSTSTGSFGRVQVGTAAAPVGKAILDVRAVGANSDVDTASILNLKQEASSTTANIRFNTASANSAGHIIFSAAGFQLRTDAGNLTTFADNGRVGIGDASPGSPLDVKSGEAANTANFNSTNGATNITFESGSTLIAQMEFSSAGPSQIVTRTAASLALGSNNVKTLYITDDDRVGIGLDDPGHLLDVTAADGASDNNPVARFVNSETTNGRSKGIYIRAGSTNDDFGLQIDDHDASATLLRFTGAGRLGINTISANAKLDIREGTNGQEIIYLDHTHATNQTFILFKAESTTRGTISYNSSSTQTTYNATSDERVKENIKEVDNALSMVNKIPVKKFNFKVDKNKNTVIGYIGQELIKEYPQAVTLMEAEGYDDFHMVDNSKLVPVLMKAVQELSKQVEDQAKRIKELEN